MSKPFYITTTLPYVNAAPHIGHALEFVRADVIARFKREQGAEVFFNTGTDEHGLKIFENAQKEAKDVKVYVDGYAELFKELHSRLNISYDSFIRTTDEIHIEAAQEIWKRCNNNGYIYKKNYKSKYCSGCELSKTDSELVDGKCPDHPTRENTTHRRRKLFLCFFKAAR
jgi:methionyl-tRNA synthetase